MKGIIKKERFELQDGEWVLVDTRAIKGDIDKDYWEDWELQDTFLGAEVELEFKNDYMKSFITSYQKVKFIFTTLEVLENQ